MNRRRLIAIVALLAVGAVLVLWRVKAARAGDPNRLLVHGNIELTEIDLSFKLPGRLVELGVDEGQSVKAGQVLARLDEAELQRTRERETATAAGAASNLTQLLTGIQYQKAAVESDIALKRADVAAAEARVKELVTGSRPQEIEQARAAAAEAGAAARQAAADWERAQQLYKNEDISTAQHDQFRMRFESTRAAVARAAETLKLLEEGPRKETIEAAKANLERARAALALAEAGRIEVRRREQEVTARQADVARSEAQVKVVETQLAERALTAPVDALVLSKSAERGEVLAAGAAVLTLGDLRKPWVRAYVPEPALGRVKIGMPVEVRSDSYPDRVFKGRLTFIASQAEFTPKTIQTEEERVKLVYRVKIEVENEDLALKNNMPVDAVIVLDGK